MVSLAKQAAPALGGIGAGAFVAIIAIILGGVIYTGEGYGTEPEPPEQIYFF